MKTKLFEFILMKILIFINCQLVRNTFFLDVNDDGDDDTDHDDYNNDDDV